MTPDRPNFLTPDRLYGTLEFTDNEQRIINTPEIQRLSDISLSAVPPVTIGKSVSSRLQHSLGAAYLAKLVVQRPEFEKYSQEFVTATTAHDSGSSPFSHVGERFLVKVFGESHEQFAERVIRQSELSREMAAQDIDIDMVIRMINGKFKPISDVLAGSMDVDNLDNIQRYGQDMEIIKQPLYSGERLARAYTIKDGEVKLEPGVEEDVKGWLESRHRVYQYVYSAENQVMGAMMRRALQFAYEEGELVGEFFFWTDTKALEYLLVDCNRRTQSIVRVAKEQKPYHVATDLVLTSPSSNFVELCNDSDNREVVADRIAEQFGIPREHVCAYFGKSRNYREVHLPVLDSENDFHPDIEQEWTAQLFVHPDHTRKTQKIDTSFRRIIGINT